MNEQKSVSKSVSFRSSSTDEVSHWHKQWLYVGSVFELTSAGEFFTVQAALTPVIIARNHDDKLIVLNNSCRHRGSRVCQTERGSKNNFVCPYHQWTYDLDGQLTYAHFMMDEIEISDFKLIPLHGKIQNEDIYIHLSPQLLDNKQTDLEYFFESSIEDNELINNTLLFQININATIHEDVLSFKDEDFLSIINLNAFDKFEKKQQLQRLAGNAIKIHYPSFYLSVRVLLDRNGEMIISLKCFANAKHAASLKDVLCCFINDNDLLWETVSFQHDELVKQWNNAEMLEAIANIAEPDVLHKEAIQFETYFDEKKVWNSASENLTCTMIIDETSNVKTFTFQTAKLSWFHYNPGQFITLEIPVAAKPLLRTYTLSSSPSRPLSISITIKAQAQSIGTRWLFENFKVGDSIKAYGPAGQFSFFHQPAEKYLFISAGSGITPMMSMSRWLFDNGSNMDVNFISCVQSPNDILFQDELERMARRIQDFHLTWVCENDQAKSWTGFTGRFNKLMLALIVADYMERDVYCCGPPPFMKAVREAFFDAGFNMSRYFEESFSTPKALETEFDLSNMPDKNISVDVKFSKSDKHVSLSQNGTILQAAKTASIAIPSACGIGVCGTCKVKLISGDTHMVHNGGINQREIDQGYILACCTKPLNNIVIDV